MPWLQTILILDMISIGFRLANFLIFCIIAVGFCGVAKGQAILAPPFGLHWGDTPDKVLNWAYDKKLDVTMQMPGKEPDLRIIRVESSVGSLPDHQAYALETRYHQGKMFEVALHYGAPEIDSERLVADFNELKTALTLKHGAFTPNNKQEKNEAGFIRKSVSYHIEPVRGLMLLLVLSELEDTIRKKHSTRFSLLYRNQNIIPK